MKTRQCTNKLLEMVDDGLLNRDYLIMACLKYMSEYDVRDMAHANEIYWQDEDEDEDEDEDAQP